MTRAGSSKIQAVGVVVPAHNEEAHIERCLRGLVLALEQLPRETARAVCLVLDRCADRTAERVFAELDRLSTRGTVLSVEIVSYDEPATIGALRDTGLRRTLRLLDGHPLAATWLVSTDADTTVGRSWVLDHLRYAEKGADAVVGMAELDDLASLGPHSGRRYARILAAGVHGDRHTHVYGANLGVRANAYLAVDGFPPSDSGEDHRLCERLRVAGHHVVSPTDVRVRTSSRRHGRASGGLAELLRGLPQPGDSPVTGPTSASAT
jgi:hypothetical protein